ncbi:hypothetical protein [Streptomyces sp. NPDC058084]|uniref:nSTAND1 domain-containing NTPase n=1 Tax=Streptomyces sp. NPDC058084 TaxID=3346333 RepID=UPI0036E2B6CE
MSTADDDGEGWSEEADEEDPSSRSYASGRDMYVAEQGDVHLYIESPEGDREHRTVGPVTDDCPYPGLAPFTAGQADRFHGRRRLLTELGERLADCHADHRPLVVVAPSGAGKTSLLQAGLSQDLDRGRIPVPGSRHWPRLLLTPTARPLRELTTRLAELAGEVDPTADWWTTDRAGFADRLRRTAGGSGRVLVVVDQAEELFTLCADEEERRAFVKVLEWLAGGAVALVVLALRADFYARCAELPWLRAAVQNNQLLLPPMTRDELLDAIRLPARAAGLRLEPGLAEVLVADFGATHGFAEPGALPLLAHALRATWQNRQGRLLTVAGYTGTGGVAHALGNSADRVHDQLDPAGRRIARRLFLGMVNIGEDTADSRRRIRRDHLLASFPDKAAAEAVLAAFTGKRLLVQERDTVSLTHEALLSAWPLLHGWINDDRPRNLVLQDLDTAARAWHATGREPDALHRGKPLDRALAAAAHPSEEDPLRRAFLDASLLLRKRVVRGRRRIVAVLTALALVASVTTLLALRSHDSAQAEQRAALAARITTQADDLRTADPALAARLDLVAHRLAPRPATTTNLLVDANTVMTGRLNGFRRLVVDTAYRPDGRVLAALDTGGVIRLWDIDDPARPEELGKPIEAGGLPLRISFSPNGRLLAASRMGATAVLWNVTDPARPVPVDLPLGAGGRGGNLVAFAPDGRTLVGSGATGRMLAWSLADPVRPVLLPGAPTRSAGAPYAFGPDGRTLAGTSGDRTVRIWDLAHPDRAPARLEPPDARAEGYRIAYRPDGRYLALSNDTKVWVWDLTDPARPRRLPYYLPANGSATTSLAFSRDGRTLVVADGSRTVRLWNLSDPDAPRSRPSLPTPSGAVRGLAFAPDGRTVVGGTDTGPVMVWHLPDAALPAAADDTRALAFAPDGRWLATGGRGGAVRLWSLADRAGPRVVGTLSAGTGEVTALAFGSDGRTLAAATLDVRDGRISRWDISDPGRPRRLLERATARDSPSAALGPDGRTAVVRGSLGVEVWGLAGPEGAAAAADRPLKTGEGGVGSLAVSSEGRIVGVGHDDGDFSLWVGTGPSPVTRVPGSLPDMLAPQVLALSPDGRALAKADQGRLTTWDLADPARPVARGAVTGSSDVMALAFAARGDVLAVGDADGTVRLTDPAGAGALSRPLSAGSGRITALAFAPDGLTLAAAGEAQPVRLWSTDPDAAARWICRVTGNVLTPAQWAQYVPGLPYDPPCKDRP